MIEEASDKLIIEKLV